MSNCGRWVTGIPHVLKFVIYKGKDIIKFKEGVWGIPAIIFFGPALSDVVQ